MQPHRFGLLCFMKSTNAIDSEFDSPEHLWFQRFKSLSEILFADAQTAYRYIGLIELSSKPHQRGVALLTHRFNDRSDRIDILGKIGFSALQQHFTRVAIQLGKFVKTYF